MSNSDLEKEFQETLHIIGPAINRKLALANKALVDADAHPAGARALNEASELAEEHGIPFHSKVVAIVNHVAPLEYNHVPDSFFEKFGSLDPNKVAELTSVASFALTRAFSDEEENEDEDGEWESSEEDEGWTSSRVC